MEGGDGLDPVGPEALHQIPGEFLAFDEHDDGGQHRQPAPLPLGPNANLGAADWAAGADQAPQALALNEARGRVDEGARQPLPGRRGLQRFLDLVNNDREDEWDSDELDDDF